MKKLLTIMLAVLLAVPAIAASAEDNVKNADIIIVGAGGGGLSAAIEAVNDGAQSVIVLEKTGKTGGSLNFTSGSMSGAAKDMVDAKRHQGELCSGYSE